MNTNIEKNKQIGASRAATKLKRQNQMCKTFVFKINKSSLNKKQAKCLKMIFIEAKWTYNYIIGNELDIFNLDYKTLTNITRRDKDNNDIPVTIEYLGSSLRQSVIEDIGSSIKGLAALKKKGYEVGAIKCKSEYKSINLKQYNTTHSIRGNKFKIQGIKDPIRVSGLKQLSKYPNIEYANAHLLFNGYDYFVSLTCYINKEDIPVVEHKNHIIGIDMGLETTVTCSNGDKFSVQVEETERLKKLQASLARKVKHSNNWYKTKALINKEYAHINNIKNDKTNKIVSKLLNENDIIVMQDEQIDSWKHTGNEYADKERCKTIQHSILGRVKSKLKPSDQVVVLDKWFPTSKYCFECGTKFNDLEVTDRIFRCPICGAEEDRDIHAANNMIGFYLRYKDTVGTTDTSKPVTIEFRKEFVVQQEDTTL